MAETQNYEAKAVFGVQFSPNQNTTFRNALRTSMQDVVDFIDPNNARDGWMNLLPESSSNPDGYPADLTLQPEWVNNELFIPGGVKGNVEWTATGPGLEYCTIPDPIGSTNGHIVCYAKYIVVDATTGKVYMAEATSGGATFSSPVILSFAAVVEYL